ncbi:Uma2 family endonuclease [Picosynechococcus sp. NKBG15041c]|uniref:Uma2 family endonuclease n=1 Tax=Picosynechococcus sp. NKBG15041c TaxID=1407650 RepID=UPI000464FA9C|nr:Uma2 family endonuclease [Picosynechococcus sp. NKBG15041c]
MIALPSGFSPQEYLELEAQSTIRHEYRQGLVYAMAGGSDDHSRIAINFLTALNLHLRDNACRFFAGDVKVNYADQFFYYPDAFVTCDPRDRQNRYVKQFPKLIAEVLSPATATFDRIEKFQDYQKIDTFEEYVLIAQTHQEVEIWRRLPQGWSRHIYLHLDTLFLTSIQLEIPVADLYRGTSLDTSEYGFI